MTDRSPRLTQSTKPFEKKASEHNKTPCDTCGTRILPTEQMTLGVGTSVIVVCVTCHDRLNRMFTEVINGVCNMNRVPPLVQKRRGP